jgi:hypothetical protein
MAVLERLAAPWDGIPAWIFVLRLFWIAAQLVLVICLGRKGVLFFYQAF